jgi:uncharacterized protein (TIGR03435 family)
MRRVPLLIGVAVLSTSLFAQTPANPSFEVVSIKPNNSGANSSSVDTQLTGRLIFTNETLRVVIQRAYQIQAFQLVGAPDWTGTARFDINAKAPDGVRFLPAAGGAPPVHLLMLRSLLADRFKLRAHTEQREMQAHRLVMARPDRRLGPQLSPTDRDCAAVAAAGKPTGVPQPGERLTCGLIANDGRIAGGARSMAQFATQLSRLLNRVITDDTKLTGNYDFTLDFSTDAVPNIDLPSAETALQEQLGLKIESQRVPVEVLVIDHVERPTDN